VPLVEKVENFKHEIIGKIEREIEIIHLGIKDLKDKDLERQEDIKSLKVTIECQGEDILKFKIEAENSLRDTKKEIFENMQSLQRELIQKTKDLNKSCESNASSLVALEKQIKGLEQFVDEEKRRKNEEQRRKNEELVNLRRMWEGTLLTDHNHQRTLMSWVGSHKKWKVLYRGSRDGFTAENFHTHCNNRGETVTIIRSTTNHLFGGYSPIPWKSAATYQVNQQCFIFTLTNPHNIPPTKFMHKTSDKSYSIYDVASHGPTFGGGYDITVSSGCNSNENNFNFPYTYEDTTGKGSNTFTASNTFRVAEIEVFGIQ